MGINKVTLMVDNRTLILFSKTSISSKIKAKASIITTRIIISIMGSTIIRDHSSNSIRTSKSSRSKMINGFRT